MRKALRVLRNEGINALSRRIWSKVQLLFEYDRWLKKYGTLTDGDRTAIRRHIEELPFRPLISLVMPTYRTPEKWLRLTIESVRRQLYPNWELCIADDASCLPHVRQILEEYRAIDSRLKVVYRNERGHISAASNSAIEIATGEFLALLDHDDELPEHALYMVVVELNADRDADLIYSDEDKIDEKGRRYDPHFKPDWNPALFLSNNFICHLGVYRARIIREIGGFRVGYEGSQDWDLTFRVIEKTRSSHIRHIPHVLYHWRATSGSAALGIEEKEYARETQLRTLESYFERQKTNVTILPATAGYWRIKYSLPEPPPVVTLIIPTRNGFDLLRNCVESICQKTTYRKFEIVIVDNQSDDPSTLQYLTRLEREGKVRVLRYDAPFNFSAINNFAVRHSQGEIIGLINNDVEVITPGWLEEMLTHVVQPEVGAVGAMLYYRNRTIQHAGVILGLGGNRNVANHAYKNRPNGYRGYASRALLSQNISAVTAACLLVRRQVFDEVGGLDETHLPVAYNDIDLCLRLRERGYLNLWTPYAELYHYESVSRGYEDTVEKQKRLKKESEYMWERWGDLLLNDPAYNPNLGLDGGGSTLAFPPRAKKPWLIESDDE